MPPFKKYIRVDYLKQFVIPFSGLELGNHQYSFAIGDEFFESIEYSEFSQGDLQVDLELEKQERMMIFRFHITGIVDVDCDRCLEPLELFVDDKEQLIVKFGNEYVEESDEVIVIPAHEYQFDISHYLYEFISLSLPVQRFHPDDENGNSTCNPEFLEQLNAHAQEQEIDPRWEKLRGLMTEDNEEDNK